MGNKKRVSLDGLDNLIKPKVTTEEEAVRAFWSPTIPVEGASGINNITQITNCSSIIELSLDKIIPDPHQPRKYFENSALEELQMSIAERGVEQPIMVRPYKNPDVPTAEYMIITGERRWRASVALGLFTIPAILKEADDADAFLSAMVENIQRENLHFLDEALAYQEMLDKGYVSSQLEIAKKIGRSKQSVSEKLKLLALPQNVKTLIYDNKNFLETHCIALARVKDHEFCTQLAEKIQGESLSVAKLTQFIKAGSCSTKRPKSSFRPVQISSTQKGFNLFVKYRIDRPEDKKLIVETLKKKIEEIEAI